MFRITEKELTAALAKLPAPDSEEPPCYTIPLPRTKAGEEGRFLTFHKMAHGDGLNTPLRDEWVLEHTPRLWRAEERDGRPGGRTFDEADDQCEWEAMVTAAVDMMVETVTSGDPLDETGQAGLQHAGQLLIPLFDLENCEHLGDRCRDREKDLLREAAEAGHPYGIVGEDYTPSLEQLQDAAYARGEQGPLDNDPEELVLTEGEEFALNAPVPGTEPDLDYFEIAKGIREAAAAYNAAVDKAYYEGRIAVTATVFGCGTLRVDTIKLELAL